LDKSQPSCKVKVKVRVRVKVQVQVRVKVRVRVSMPDQEGVGQKATWEKKRK